MRVFASYSRRDAAEVDAIVDALQARGHDAWIDTDDIRGGERWRRSIVDGLTGCERVLLFLTPASVASEHVAREVALADEAGKPILPVVLRDVEPGQELRYQLAGLQRLDVRGLAAADAAAAIDGALVGPGDPAVAPVPPPPAVPLPGGPGRSAAGVVPARRRPGVLLGATLALVAVAVVALVVRGGRGGDGGAATLGGAVTRATAEPATPTGPVGPTTQAAAGASGALPGPVTFTDRVFWAGRPYALFRIEIVGGSVDAPNGIPRVTLRARVRNRSSGQAYLETATAQLVYGAERSTLLPDQVVPIPGGATAEMSLSASVTPAFRWADAAVVIGGPADNGSTVPLDPSRPVKTVAPIEGPGKAIVADGGAGLRITIVDAVLWPDYRDGAAGAYGYDLLAEITFDGGAAIDYEDVAPTLRSPDGTTSGATFSQIFTANEGGIVPHGRTSRQGYHLAVRGGIDGTFTLTWDTRSVRIDKRPGAVVPTATFTVRAPS